MEQKKKYVSYNTIDQAIFEFEHAVRKAFPKCEIEPENQVEYNSRQIMDGIKYYVLTDRAPLEFMGRFVNLNTRELGTLARRCWKSGDKSTRNIINIFKNYLKMEEE